MANKINHYGRLKTEDTFYNEHKTNIHLRQMVSRINAWYTNRTWGGIILFTLLVIDMAGFYQIATNTLDENALVRGVMIGGFAVAFELAPLYIGYILCLQSYGWAVKPFHTLIGIFSLSACGLGVLGNTVYRFLTLESAYDDLEAEAALGITIVMCLLPVITSLINLVIGCLSFDPLYFYLMKLSKQIAILKEKERQLNACIEEYKVDEKCEEQYQEEEKSNFECIKKQIEAMKTELKNYETALHMIANEDRTV